MRSAPEIKGWCPGALAPMESGDGLLMRAKVVGSRLTLGQAREIANISLECGNGLLDLSQRAQLQMRGLKETTREAAQQRLKAIDLLAPDAATESVLNIIASPVRGGEFDSNEMAEQLARGIMGDRALRALPGKFLFLVDEGGAPGLFDVAADIRLEAYSDKIAIVIDGACDLAVVATPEEAIDVALALARAFVSLREGRAFQLRRMRALVEALGAAPVLNAAGLQAEPYRSTCRGASMRDLLGAQRRADACFAGVAAPFGRCSAEDLAQFVEVVLQEGGQELRLTPWRALLSIMPSFESAVRVVEAAHLLRLIVHPDDARLAIAACPGAPECPQARGATRDHLDRLAPIARLLSPHTIGLHMSGCAKGCAKPSPSPVTLIACGKGFDLVYDGCADGATAATSLSFVEVETLLAARANTESSCPA